MDSTLLYNGKIRSGDSIYDWMIVNDGVFSDFGHGDKEWSGERIDLQQQLVLPGLHDSHIHVHSLGRFLSRLSLKKVGSIEEIKTKLQDFSKDNQSEWIIGGGWDQDYMEDGRYPNRIDIDDVVSDKPVLLYRGCNHIGLVNSKGLEIIGITKETDDPHGGKIDRDEDNQATGILRETALSLVAPFIKNVEASYKKEHIKKGLAECLKTGLTAVHTNDAKAWKYYAELEEAGELPIRVFLTVPYDELGEEETPAANQQQGMLRCQRVKLFADGSLGAETAALREPYSGTQNYGILILQPDEMKEKVAKSHQLGYQLEVHAIGDWAAEIVLDAFDAAGLNANDRAIVTHCQILGEDLVQRMRTRGYIANIQPPFVPTDSLWVEKRLGNSPSIQYAYAWKTLLDNNVHCAGGSDAPIEIPDPFYGIYCAIVRPDPRGNPWRIEEALSFDEAVELYTTSGAYAVKQERSLGKLEKGYHADFVVVNPIIEMDPQALLDNPLRQVWVAGIKRYG